MLAPANSHGLNAREKRGQAHSKALADGVLRFLAWVRRHNGAVERANAGATDSADRYMHVVQCPQYTRLVGALGTTAGQYKPHALLLVASERLQRFLVTAHVESLPHQKTHH